MPETQLLDIPAIVALTGLSARTVRELVYVKRCFPIVRVGRRVYVRLSDLLRWLDDNTSPARG